MATPFCCTRLRVSRRFGCGHRDIPSWPALVAQAGMDAAQAALLVTQFALALIPLACYWALTLPYGITTALCTALLCVTAPGLLIEANLASPDTVFLLLAMLALGCVVRNRFGLAGLLAGIALCVHNTGVALFLAMCVAAATDNTVPRKVCSSLARIALGGIASRLPRCLELLGTRNAYPISDASVHFRYLAKST
jgi:hypothetical protein